MVSTILSQVTGQLERRFLLNAFFPTLIFSTLVGLVVATGVRSVSEVVDLWDDQSSLVQTLLVIGSVAAVLVLANVVANGTLAITRLFEGYAAPASWFADWGRNYHHWRAGKILRDNPELFEQRYPVHPRKLQSANVAPTRLGNLLRSAESYPQDRYGVDAVRVWPRLYHVLPEGLRASMGEARASMEFLLVIAFLAGLYTAFSTTFLLIVAGPPPWFVGSLLGGTGVSLIAYWAALTPAAIYGDHIRAAFDLHRLKLLQSIQMPVPATLDEERRIWDHAIAFLDGGHPHGWRYVGDP
jgi:hypothetical protein